MEFSQSVLFTHHSDSLPSTHTARWGEQDTNWATDSEGNTEELGTETDNGDTQDHAENKEENTPKTRTESELTSDNSVYNDTSNDQSPPVSEKEEALTHEDAHSEQATPINSSTHH